MDFVRTWRAWQERCGKDIAAEDLLRYGLSLPLVHAAVIGTDSVEVVRKKAALLRDFKPLSAEEMTRLSVKLEPFFVVRPAALDAAGIS